jgi:hypothetical protein
MSEISPTLQALLEEQADVFKRQAESAINEMDALTFFRWVADTQYTYARQFASAARKERETPKPRLTLDRLIAAQHVNDNRNTCDCVHCAPYLRAAHGNGCSGYHCSGTCIAVPLERCGRCGRVEHPDLISVTGPYHTCPACTAIIRN